MKVQVNLLLDDQEYIISRTINTKGTSLAFIKDEAVIRSGKITPNTNFHIPNVFKTEP